MKTINNIIEEAKEEFDKRWLPLFQVKITPNDPEKSDMAKMMERVWENDGKELRNFLSHSLTKGIRQALESVRLEKRGKHDSKCEHDNNWCVTHAEELVDDEYEEYGRNSTIDDLDTKINKLKE